MISIKIGIGARLFPNWESVYEYMDISTEWLRYGDIEFVV